MKALLITPADQRIEAIEVSGHDAIAGLIGFDTIASDEVGPQGDRLFFDEECFIRGDAVEGRFQIDSVAPVAGKGIVIGSADDGATLGDVHADAESLGARVKWL